MANISFRLDMPELLYGYQPYFDRLSSCLGGVELIVEACLDAITNYLNGVYDNPEYPGLGRFIHTDFFVSCAYSIFDNPLNTAVKDMYVSKDGVIGDADSFANDFYWLCNYYLNAILAIPAFVSLKTTLTPSVKIIAIERSGLDFTSRYRFSLTVTLHLDNQGG